MKGTVDCGEIEEILFGHFANGQNDHPLDDFAP